MKTIKDKEYSFNHTKDRLRERFNLLLTRDEYESLCNLCKLNNSYPYTLIAKESGDQEIHKIFFKDLYIKFTFNSKNGWITTALPNKKGEY